MNSKEGAASDPSEEIAALMLTLQVTEHRLHELTGGKGNALAPALNPPGELSYLLKEAREKLRQSEERFQNMFTASAIGIAVSTPQGRFLYANVAYCRMLGYTEAELQELNFAALTHPDDLSLNLELRDELLAGKREGFVMEKRYLKKSGEIVWTRHSVSATHGAGGEIATLMVVAEDITERKLAEESLALFRTLIDVSPDAIEVIDPETGRFLNVNTTGCARLGYSREEMLSLTLAEVDVEKDYHTLWPVIVDEIKKAGSLTIIGRHRRKDGSTFPVEVNSRYIHLNRGYMVAVVRDITERVIAEQRLHEHAALLDIARDAIMVRDLDHSILYWNRGAESVYGWTKAEAMGSNGVNLLGTNPEKYEAAYQAMLETGEWSGELRQVSKKGAPVIVVSRWTLLRDAEGKPKSMLSINTDVTEHKKLEEQFLRAQRLESIGTLASGVAHDLNNILAPILMAAPVLREEIPRELRDSILANIEASAQRGADIVKQVLTFARGAEGERLPVQPAHLIKDMAHIAEETFPRSIRIRSKCEPLVWPIEADPTQMHQVLLNLCVNARDAMPDGGDLVLSAENLLIDEHLSTMIPGSKPGPYVLLEVSDSGTGIPGEILDKIFDPFFTTKAAEKGTGLGLSTTIGIVKSHGGVINVTSDVGIGTTFKVYLPAARDARTDVAVEEGGNLPPRGHGELLLVVDDEQGIREMAQLILQNHGYRVLAAADGTEALTIFAQQREEIKTVITDVMMPHLDGVTLVRALRKMEPKIAIIASTGRSDEARVKQLSALNVPLMLIKPYTKQTLLAAVRDALAAAEN